MLFIGSTTDRDNQEDCKTPRIIYKEASGVFTLVSYTFDEKKTQELYQGKARVELAACVIYESVSKSDRRRWKATSQHVFRGQTFQIHAFTEEEVSPDEKQCNVEPPYGR
jgi:hypothetical protein